MASYHNTIPNFTTMKSATHVADRHHVSFLLLLQCFFTILFCLPFFNFLQYYFLSSYLFFSFFLVLYAQIIFFFLFFFSLHAHCFLCPLHQPESIKKVTTLICDCSGNPCYSDGLQFSFRAARDVKIVADVMVFKKFKKVDKKKKILLMCTQ